MVLKKKNKVKVFNPRNIGIKSGEVFINENLCRCFKYLLSKYKTL